MSDQTENTVPEDMPVTGLNNPSLDADMPDTDTLASLDALLDESEKAVTQPIERVEEPTQDLLSDQLNLVTPEVEPPAPVPIDTTTEPIVSDDPGVEIDPEIASIERPRNLSEKNQSNWRKMQETATKYKKEAEEASMLKQRLQVLESSPAKTPNDYEELRQFRAIWDLKNDPNFKSKYEEPIKNASQSIYTILKRNGASDEVIESIEKAGGPDKIDGSWWKNQALDKLPLTDSERLKKNLVEVSELKEQQEQEVSSIASHQEEWLNQREQAKMQVYKHDEEEILSHVEQLTKDVPWARFQEVPDGATEEKVAQITRHNEAVSSLNEKFTQALYPTTARSRAEVAAAAVASHVLAERLRIEQTQTAQLQDQLKRLTAENSQLKSAGKIPKPATNGASVKVSPTDRWKMNASDAIDLGLEEASGR